MNTSRELKQLRADLDLLIVLAKQLTPSREVSLAFTKLQEGKMHVGNTIFETEDYKVYVNSNDPSNKIIDAYHVDSEIIAMQTPNDWSPDHVERVKILRRELSAMLVRIKSIGDELTLLPSQLFARDFLLTSYIKMRECQNWFGMELARIRESSITK